MTDRELSNLLQEWKRTPAPARLDARVFGFRRPPAPIWWDRVPASLTAAIGAAAGGFAVWFLINLVAPTQPVHPAPAPVISQAEPPIPPAAVEPPPVQASQQPIRRAKQARKAKRAVVPPTEQVATVPPRLLNGPVPLYPTNFPPIAAAITVKLRIRIGKDGRVIEAEIIEGDPLLDSIAVEAVKRWLYTPRLENGEPAEEVTEVDVVFEPMKKIPK